ncbi:ras family-domain-containing protein [Mycena crocata]|nr:ras family-domain-containing protein [Mycena crocata]
MFHNVSAHLNKAYHRLHTTFTPNSLSRPEKKTSGAGVGIARPVHRFLRQYNLVLVGAGGVGKTVLSKQFVEDHYAEDYDPTIEDSYRKQCVIDGEVALLDILDTAGQPEYAAMREQYMRTGEGFLLVYSITSRDSFEDISTFHEQILRVKDQDSFPVIIVANKCDLKSERRVGMAEGRNLATHLGCDFIETSGKDCINVEEAFTNLVQEIRRVSRGIRIFDKSSGEEIIHTPAADLSKPYIAAPQEGLAAFDIHSRGHTNLAQHPARRLTPSSSMQNIFHLRHVPISSTQTRTAISASLLDG